MENVGPQVNTPGHSLAIHRTDIFDVFKKHVQSSPIHRQDSSSIVKSKSTILGEIFSYFLNINKIFI